MKKIAGSLYNIAHNSFLWLLIAILVLGVNFYIFYRANYKEDYSISYASQRLTITLQGSNYIEVFRLHDYWVTEDGQLIQLAEDKDKFSADYQQSNFNGSITEVSEEVVGRNANIESYLLKTDKGGLKLVRKVYENSNAGLAKTYKLNMQFALGGSSYSFDEQEKLLKADKCSLKFDGGNNLEFRFQEQDKVLTIYQKSTTEIIQSGEYEFNFDILVYCE